MARTWTPSQEAAMKRCDKAMLVSAAAGSGKTSVLTERIIRSLTDNEHPADLSRMLVVTFTRAAAAELKGRIAEALTDALAADPSNTRLSKQLLLLGSAQISTIDSFFQKQVRENFEQLEIPPSFRIADSGELLHLSYEILDELIEDFYRRYNSSHQDNALLKNRENSFAAAMDHLISHRSDGKLNGVLLDFYEKFSKYPQGIELLLKSAKQMRADAEKPFFESNYGKTLLGIQAERIRGTLSFLQSIEREMQGYTECYMACSGILSSDIDFCNAFLRALEEKDYSRVVTVVNSLTMGRFPTLKHKPDIAVCYHEWRKEFKKENDEKIKEIFLWTEEEICEQLLRTAELCEMLYRLYSEYRDCFLAEKKSRGILEHDDVRAMLYRLLTLPDGSPSPFANSLSEQYDAVYIDEYQDVDSMQDSIFSLIGKNKRFMVGDIKQSIYGFRGSEPLIFANYRRTMPLYTDPLAERADGISVFMSENFRCNQPVVDFANRVCSYLFSACEESIGYRPQDDLVRSKPLVPDAAPIPARLAVFEAPPRGKKNEESDSAQEPLWVVQEIQRLLREERLDNGERIVPSDIAILVRTSKQVDKYVEALRTAGIPVSDSSAANLLHSPLMTDLLNLLRTVDNPYRDLPLSEFLLSDIGGFTLEELGEIRASAPLEKTLFDALVTKAEGSDQGLSKKAKELACWIQKMQEIASVESVDRFLHLLCLEERMIPYAREEALLYLYEQARTYQKSSWNGLYGFLNYFTTFLQKGEGPASGFHRAEDAVSVMTIHKSKGLEFPVVFVSDCGSPFTLLDLRSPILFHKKVGFAATLYNPNSGNYENTILSSTLKLLTEQDLKEESIRTLYVALTRARERLYVTGTLKGKLESAKTSAERVWRGHRSSILKCQSYLSWILAAYYERMPRQGEFPCTFHGFSADAPMERVQSLPTEAQPDQVEALPVQAVAPSEFAARYAEILTNSKSYDYPLSYLQGLPTKVAASRLREDLLDALTDDEADHDEAIRAQLDLMRSSRDTSFDRLLLQKSTPSAAEIGTATHAVLELCDFERLSSVGIDAECARLVEEGFLDEHTISIVDKSMLEGFLRSELFKIIQNAKKIYREQKFGLFVPMGALTQKQSIQEQLSTLPLYVQGSIDLILETEDNRLILVDYKTDHVKKNEIKNLDLLANRMEEKHKNQLCCYARAVKELFGRDADEIYIYALSAGALLPARSVQNKNPVIC